MIKAIDGVVHSKKGIDRYVHGYTVVDGIKAILSFSYSEYSLLYGWASQRAIFFTDVKLGRSPMIAIRVHPLKPAAVVYIQADRVDEQSKTFSREIGFDGLIVTKLFLPDS